MLIHFETCHISIIHSQQYIFNYKHFLGIYIVNFDDWNSKFINYMNNC
jgi:hypothetical protein